MSHRPQSSRFNLLFSLLLVVASAAGGVWMGHRFFSDRAAETAAALELVALPPTWTPRVAAPAQPQPTLPALPSPTISPAPPLDVAPDSARADAAPAATAIAPAATIAPIAPAAPAPPTAPPTPAPVLFRVEAEQVHFSDGPGSAYPPIAVARQGSQLLVTGRTTDGAWWQVCCLDGGEPVWMALGAETRLESGDVGTVTILDVVVRDAPPPPPPPAAPPPMAGAAVSLPEASPLMVAEVAPPAPPLPPPATPLPAGNPACAIAGASYATIPVLGGVNPRPGRSDPELNLSLRGYAPVDGFRQLVGIGGETDPHAPLLFSFFDDQRINNDFPAVFQVHEWDWTCNCRRGLIAEPEVTLAAISTRPGELLRVPDRSSGDIGGGFRAMVLYASPTQLMLKYTREDDILSGYGLHIEGICVDPALLNLYYQMDAAGRSDLPALLGGQPIGYAIGGDIKVAVRDSGQFMDPRSMKDWWQPR